MRAHGSVRVRTTAAAVVVVGLTLGLSAIALSTLLRRSLERSVKTSAELRSADVASLVRSGRLPASIPELANEHDRTLVQVVDERGRLLASSAALEDKASIPQFLRRDQMFVTGILRHPDFEDDENFVVVARRVPASGGSATVYVAESLHHVDETGATVDRMLVLGLPLVLVAVGVTAWLMVGRALRPVESMRAQVADITAHDLARRLPEPAAKDEIGRLARTMNGMLDRLQIASDRQRRFVADASHELQTPLASVRAHLEVGLGDSGATDWPTTVSEVLDEQDRMERLVQDLLFMARSDERPRPARELLVDLDDLALEETTRVRAHGRVGIDVSGLSGGQVVGDADQLRRVIRNLLDNAERYAQGTVGVELRTQGATVELVVSDDGGGIQPADRARVFERFTRIDNGRARAQGGTGLGLAIAKEVVEAHGGTISVLDSDRGTRIGIRLPRAQQTAR